MSASHFGDVIEFWYQKERPEIIKPMLNGIAREGLLDQPEKQLFFAAFFSRLLQTGALDSEMFTNLCIEQVRGLRRMAAWSLHLANAGAAKKMCLLDENDHVLAKQIESMPSSLLLWPVREPATVFMLWGAFMADGDEKWLRKIIECALKENRGVQSRSQKSASSAAAASLYEYGPRHPLIGKVLKQYEILEKQNPLLKRLISHAAGNYGL